MSDTGDYSTSEVFAMFADLDTRRPSLTFHVRVQSIDV